MANRNAIAIALLVTCQIALAGEDGLRSTSLQAETDFDFKGMKVVFCVRNSTSRPVDVVRDTLPWIDTGAVLFDVLDYKRHVRDEEWGSSIFITPAIIEIGVREKISGAVDLTEIVSPGFISTDEGQLLIRWNKAIRVFVQQKREEVLVGNWILLDFKEEEAVNSGQCAS